MFAKLDGWQKRGSQHNRRVSMAHVLAMHRTNTTTQRLRLRTFDLKLTKNCQIRFRTCDSRRLAENSSQHNRHVLVVYAHAMRHANAQQRNAPLPQHVNVESNTHSWRCEIYVVRTASLPARARRQH